MPTRAFLDSNVFLFALERPGSSSRRLVQLLSEGAVHGVVTDRIVREMLRYFRRHYPKDVGAKFRDFLIFSCELVLEEDLPNRREFVGAVGAKDARALAAVRTLGISRLVSTDSDFTGVPEWRTPREFLLELGERPRAGQE